MNAAFLFVVIFNLFGCCVLVVGHDCAIENVKPIDWETYFKNSPVLDTEGSQFVKLLTTNVLSLTIEMTSPYMSAKLEDNYFIVFPKPEFGNYESTENSQTGSPQLEIIVNFVCVTGTGPLNFVQPITDTNNNWPTFGLPVYNYKLPMPFPPSIDITSYLEIIVSDIDITNTAVTFSIEPPDTDISIRYGKVTDATNKHHKAFLTATKPLWYTTPKTLTIKATDQGNPQQFTTAIVNIDIDPDSSIPPIPEFTQENYKGTYVIDENFLDHITVDDVVLKSNSIAATVVLISDHEAYFSFSQLDGVITLRLIQDLPQIDLETNTVITVIFEATLVGAGRAGFTVVSISLPPKECVVTTTTEMTTVCPTETPCPVCSTDAPTTTPPTTTECVTTVVTDCPTTITETVCPTTDCNCPTDSTTPIPTTTITGEGSITTTVDPTTTTAVDPTTTTVDPTTTITVDTTSPAPTTTDTPCQVCTTEVPTTPTECPVTDCPTTPCVTTCPTTTIDTTTCQPCDCTTTTWSTITTPDTTECPISTPCPIDCSTSTMMTMPTTTCSPCEDCTTVGVTTTTNTTPEPECPVTTPCPSCPETTACPIVTVTTVTPTTVEPVTCSPTVTELPTTPPEITTTTSSSMTTTSPSVTTTSPSVTTTSSSVTTTEAPTVPPPIIEFLKQEYSLLLVPHHQLGVTLLQVQATISSGEDIIYSLTSNEVIPSQLDFDRNEGTFKALNYIPTGIYRLNAHATGVVSAVTAQVPVTIAVDSIEMCGDGPRTAYSVLVKTIKEENAENYNIVYCNITNPEEGYSYTYNIIDVNPPVGKDYFEINSTSGSLQTKQAIDRELEAIANMYISQFVIILELVNVSSSPTSVAATSLNNVEGLRSWIDIDTEISNVPNRMLVSVIIEDINDHPPTFKQGGDLVVGYPNKNLITEIAPPHLCVVTAEDKDLGDNAAIKYKTNTAHFVVHQSTGVVYPNENALDDEANLAFMVTATDRNGDLDGLFSSINVKVKILNQEHISVIAIKSAFVEDVDEKLESLSSLTGVKIKYLTAAVVGVNDVTKAKAPGDHYLRIVCYGLDNQDQPIVTNDLQSKIDEINPGDLSVDAWQPTPTTSTGDSTDVTGYIVAVSVLAVLLGLLILAALAFYFLVMRRKSRYAKVQDENGSTHFEKGRSASTTTKEELDVPHRRPTGYAFNPPPVEEDEDDEFGEVKTTNAERRKSVTFNETVEKIIDDVSNDTHEGSERL